MSIETPENRAWIEDQREVARATCPAMWRLSIAVAAHESACGRSLLATVHNNFHGIKAVGRQERADKRGHRHFRDDTGSWRAFGYLMSQSTHYADARAQAARTRAEGADQRTAERVMAVESASIYCPTDCNWTLKVLVWHEYVWEIFPQEESE